MNFATERMVYPAQHRNYDSMQRLMEMDSMRFITFYLPQYHPIPENDAWWGKGFTDWVNVRKCTPRFPSHHQPHVPIELGYYDLLDPSVRVAQANLARSNGIDAFCYYHYWFNGKLLLNQPFDEVLSSEQPDFPFCLCWANENWTRIWDGNERQVLIGQKYSLSDHEKHIEWFLKAFKDKRYVCVNGKPLLLIYRTGDVPHIGEMTSLWKKACMAAGFPGLYLCAVRSNFASRDEKELISLGFDAIVDFQPNKQDFPHVGFGWRSSLTSLRRKIIKGINLITNREHLRIRFFSNRIISYKAIMQNVLKNRSSEYKNFPCVFPSWDNSARHDASIIIQNDTPDDFGEWLLKSAKQVEQYPPDEQLVFINAWNEWAEGCHLEPDSRFGHAFLEQTRKIKTGH
jgi:lipopolysaccharide biosynthesis protein